MKKFRNFLKGLALTMSQVLGSDCAILTDVSADMEYVDGKATGKQFGTKYTVVCPGAKYFEVVVKVPDMNGVQKHICKQIIKSFKKMILLIL